MAKILERCLSASSKTKIVNACNLNFKTVDRYLNPLIENGLIITDKETRKYKTTEKGRMFLAKLKEIEDFL